MLIADEALEPTVSTRSKPGGVLRGGSTLRGGRRPASSSCRRAKGFRMGILAERMEPTIGRRLLLFWSIWPEKKFAPAMFDSRTVSRGIGCWWGREGGCESGTERRARFRDGFEGKIRTGREREVRRLN